MTPRYKFDFTIGGGSPGLDPHDLSTWMRPTRRQRRFRPETVFQKHFWNGYMQDLEKLLPYAPSAFCSLEFQRSGSPHLHGFLFDVGPGLESPLASRWMLGNALVVPVKETLLVRGLRYAAKEAPTNFHAMPGGPRLRQLRRLKRVIPDPVSPRITAALLHAPEAAIRGLLNDGLLHYSGRPPEPGGVVGISRASLLRYISAHKLPTWRPRGRVIREYKLWKPRRGR